MTPARLVLGLALCALAFACQKAPAATPPNKDPRACNPACAAGLTCCAGKCVALISDPLNCGRCGTRCGGQTPFCQGRCTERPCKSACSKADVCCGTHCCHAGEICCLRGQAAIAPACVKPAPGGGCPTGACPGCQ